MTQCARRLWLATALLLLSFTGMVGAEDARSLPIGAPIGDSTLKIGARTWKLPPGEWKLAGRHVRDVRLNEIQGGAEVIEVLSALVRDGRLEAGLMMTGPTGGSRVRGWREDSACRVEKALLKEDSSTATLSDCLIVRVLPAIPTQVLGAEVYASTAKWVESEGIKTPRPVLNVLIVKYEGSEYFRASSWIDPSVFGLKAEEVAALTAAPEALVQWARAYRAVVAAALGKISGTFQVPPLVSR